MSTLKQKPTGLHLPGILELASLLSNQAELNKTIRWQKFYEAGMCQRQSSYEHSMELTMIANRVVLRLYPFNPQIDMLSIILCTYLHDHGEIVYDSASPGDVGFNEKINNHDHRVGELKVFSKFLDSVTRENDLFKAEILPYYLLQYSGNEDEVDDLLKNADFQQYRDLIFRHKKIEAKIFDAIENLGYVVFPYQGYLAEHSYGLEFFLTILKQHYTKLFEFSVDIKGFDYFYSKEDHLNIQNFITIHKNIEDANVIADLLLLEKSKKITFMANEP